jgi:hypothetical protein
MLYISRDRDLQTTQKGVGVRVGVTRQQHTWQTCQSTPVPGRKRLLRELMHQLQSSCD